MLLPERGLLAATLAACLLAGCSTTSLRPVEDFSPTVLREEIHAGDDIRVLTLSGKEIEAEVVSIDKDAFHIVTDEGRRLRLDFEVIRTIQVKRVSGWKLVAGTGTTLVALVTVLVVYAFVVLFSSL